MDDHLLKEDEEADCRGFSLKVPLEVVMLP